jgi:hypothetical protein
MIIKPVVLFDNNDDLVVPSGQLAALAISPAQLIVNKDKYLRFFYEEKQTLGLSLDLRAMDADSSPDQALTALICLLSFSTNFLKVNKYPVIALLGNINQPLSFLENYRMEVRNALIEQGYNDGLIGIMREGLGPQKITENPFYITADKLESELNEVFKLLSVNPEWVGSLLFVYDARTNRKAQVMEHFIKIEREFAEKNKQVYGLMRELNRISAENEILRCLAEEKGSRLENSESNLKHLKTESLYIIEWYKKENQNIKDWYHEHYERLPLWFKRIGHIVRRIAGKKSF